MVKRQEMGIRSSRDRMMKKQTGKEQRKQEEDRTRGNGAEEE